MAKASATAPEGGRFQEAHVDVDRAWPSLRASDMGPRLQRGSLTHTLVLRGKEGEIPLLLGYANAGDKEGWSRLKGARYALSFADDGHALAVSSDDGARWSYVALDVGRGAPFYCPHTRFGKEGAPFDGAPDTRSLALQILGSGTDAQRVSGPNHAEALIAGGEGVAFYAELSGAAAYARAHADDAELRLALTAALLRPGTQLNKDAPTFIDAVGALAAEHDDVRGALLDGLSGPRADRAAQALTQAADAGTVTALAEALLLAQPDGPGEIGASTWLTWALAAAAWQVKGGDPKAAQALQAAAERPAIDEASLESDKDRSLALSRAATQRRLAVAGLAALSGEDATAALKALAEGPCQKISTMEGGSKVAEDPASLSERPSAPKALRDELDADSLAHYTPGCWAKAALAAR